MSKSTLNTDELGSIQELGDLISPRPKDKGPKLSRKERRAHLRETAEKKEQNKEQITTNKLTLQSILQQNDKELTAKGADERKKKLASKDVVSWLGYEAMYGGSLANGVAMVSEGVYSETLSFSDISYQTLREDTQKSIFAVMNNIYNSFGSDQLIQFTLINKPILESEIGEREFYSCSSQPTGELKELASEFNTILNNKMKEGVSNIERELYITYAVEAPTRERAIPLLMRCRTDIISQLSNIKSSGRVLTASERLGVIQSQLNPCEPVDIDYERDIMRTHLTSKDLIAPQAIDFKPQGSPSSFKSDHTYGQVLCMRKYGSEIRDSVVSDLLDLPIPLNVTWFVQPIDKTKALAQVRMTLTYTETEILKREGKSKTGRVILPSVLKESNSETTLLLDELTKGNQRLFDFSAYIYTYAATPDELQEQVVAIAKCARRSAIEVKELPFRQRAALNSVLPLGNNFVDISRKMTTAQVSIFVPFATSEINDKYGTYYGQNKQSNNIIRVDRKLLPSPVGIICGKTGSGKSFMVKKEITGTVLSNPTDQVFILDRAGEYTHLSRALGGSVINLGVDDKNYINPFDLSDVDSLDTSRDKQIASKIDAIQAQMSGIKKQSGEPYDTAEQSIIDRVCNSVFISAEKKNKGSVPTLGDFYEELRKQPEDSAKKLALAYERFTFGPMSFFNNQSNVDLSANVVDINMKELPDSLLVFALIAILENFRNIMYANYEKGRRTWLYIEEGQSLFAYTEVIRYFTRLAREGRKFALLPTLITQEAVALFKNEEASSFIANADFLILLKQSDEDRRNWLELKALSAVEESFIDDSTQAGEGMIMAGEKRVPMHDNFPKNTKAYKLFSTDPNEQVEKVAKQKLEEARAL